MTTEDQIPNLFRVTDTPDIERQMQEFTRAGGLNGYSTRRDRNDRIRYNRWPGRSSDYKKHRDAIGADPIPWEDAWDSRHYTADDICNELTDIAMTAFTRATVDARPTGAEDIARAANARKVLTKYLDRDKQRGLIDEAEFLAQHGTAYGAAVLHVFWDRQVAMKMVDVEMDALMQAAQNAQQSLVEAAQSGDPVNPEEQAALLRAALMPEMILDPARENEAVQVMRDGSRQIAAQLFDKEVREYGEAWLENFTLSMKVARRLVRDLRNHGQGKFPAPYLHRNQPCVVTRELGYDFFCPPETTDLESAPWHIVRDWLTPAQIEENKVTDGWNPEWCERALKTAGRVMNWGNVINQDEIEVDVDEETYDQNVNETKSGLVEVCYFYHRAVTEEGIPQLWCSVWCPHVLHDDAGEILYAKHYPTENAGSYGFFGYRLRKTRRTFNNNTGLPELIGSDQMSMKRSYDMLVDRQELEINPPWMVKDRLGMRYKAGPGAQIPRKRPGDLETMPSPTGDPMLAFNLMETTQARIDNKFGLMTEKVLPARWQQKLQAFTNRYLQTWAAALNHYWRLIQEHADAAELARIAGGDVNFPRDPNELEGEYDITLAFDVKDMDMEFVFKKLEAIGKWAAQFDRAGVVDFAGLVRMAFLAIDPTYAGALVRDEQGASKMVYQQVAQDVAMMALGNEADYVENDPTAAMKLKFLEQIVQGNPRYQQSLGLMQGGQPDPLFVERMTKYQENLKFSVTQDENKKIGRIGVTPDNAEVGQ